jgi:hypothetical protein
MISHNRDECEYCSKTLYVHGAKYCSPRCEKLAKADEKFKEAMKKLPDAK